MNLNFFRFAAHADKLTEASNTIALVLASNTPFYPLYLYIILRRAGWTKTAGGKGSHEKWIDAEKTRVVIVPRSKNPTSIRFGLAERAASAYFPHAPRCGDAIELPLVEGRIVRIGERRSLDFRRRQRIEPASGLIRQLRK